MPLTAEFNFSLGDPSNGRRLHGEFADAEVAVLRDFVAFADQLGNLSIFQGKAHVGITVNVDRDKGVAFSAELPPDDLALAPLHRLRPFALAKEPTSLTGVIALLRRRVEDHDFREILARIGRYSSGQSMQDLIRITAGEHLINSEEMLTKWLNAMEYHRDPEKRR